MPILVLNAGSSSYKCSLYTRESLNARDPPPPLWKYQLDYAPDQASNLPAQVRAILENMNSEITAVGHRIVHGGDAFQKPVKISPEIKAAIKALIPLAPLHNPANLTGIEIMEALLPATPQTAVFDTAFHQSIPLEARTYPLPEKWRKMGIRRYGFHGISHEYCSLRAKSLPGSFNPQKIVCCHLGNGSSLAAIQNGVCIDTTMGFTPMEGLMMGTRCGSIDPGIIFYLQRHGISAEEIDWNLNNASGLKGIGKNSDLRTLLQLRDGKPSNPDACLAYDMLVHSLIKNIGAMVAVLGGIDCLIFTGGIGENAAILRQDVCGQLAFLNLFIDPVKNQSADRDLDISTDPSGVRIFVIKTREDYMIAKAALATLEPVLNPSS